MTESKRYTYNNKKNYIEKEGKGVGYLGFIGSINIINELNNLAEENEELKQENKELKKRISSRLHFYRELQERFKNDKQMSFIYDKIVEDLEDLQKGL